MVEKNLFTFNFKKMPWAFVICLLLIICTNFGAVYLVDNEILEISPYRKEYRYQLMQAGKVKADVLIVGGSSGLYINEQILKNDALKDDNAEILNLSVGGAMPRTFSYIFGKVNYSCVKENSLVLLCIRPIDLNRNNICFERTIISFFSWREFFMELLAGRRIDNAVYFLQKCSLYLVNYRFEIQDIIKRNIKVKISKAKIKEVPKDKTVILKPEYDKVQEERRRVTLFIYENAFATRYQLDKYQIKHMKMLIKQLKKKKANVIMVIMPMSSMTMQIIGMPDLKRFRSKIFEISNDLSTPVIDFISSTNGSEYQYFDEMHFIRASETDFTRKLSMIIGKILNN